MKRRVAACGAALGAFWPLAARTQAARGTPRIGVLSFGAPPVPGGPPPPEAAFFRALHALGYVEGRSVAFEHRFAAGSADRLVVFAAELAAANVDLIAAAGPAARHAAMAATRSIPIVTVGGSDPVREGWAQSLARPGGNVTGLTVTFAEMGAKRLELLKEAMPQLTRVAVLDTPSAQPTWNDVLQQDLLSSARRLGLSLHTEQVRRPDDVARAFEAASNAGAQALLAFAVDVVFDQRARVAELAASRRWPSISDFAPLAHSGFLFSYGADLFDLARRAAGYADRILKGARPGELPIEQPAKFQLVVNQKTARAIGLTLPPRLLLQADEVIE